MQPTDREAEREAYFDKVDSLKPSPELWQCLADGVKEGIVTQKEANDMAAFWGKYVGGLFQV